jgi:hypothetical protein
MPSTSGQNIIQNVISGIKGALGINSFNPFSPGGYENVVAGIPYNWQQGAPVTPIVGPGTSALTGGTVVAGAGAVIRGGSSPYYGGGTLTTGTSVSQLSGAGGTLAATGGNIAAQTQAANVQNIIAGGGSASQLANYLASQGARVGGTSAAALQGAHPDIISTNFPTTPTLTPDQISNLSQIEFNPGSMQRLGYNPKYDSQGNLTGYSYNIPAPQSPAANYLTNLFGNTSNLVPLQNQTPLLPGGILTRTPTRGQVLLSDIQGYGGFPLGVLPGTIQWAGQGLGELLGGNIVNGKWVPSKAAGGDQYTRLGEFAGETLPYFIPGAGQVLLLNQGISGLTNAPIPKMQRTTTSEYLQSNLGISPRASNVLAYVPPSVETGLGALGIGLLARNSILNSQIPKNPSVESVSERGQTPSGNEMLNTLVRTSYGTPETTQYTISREGIYPTSNERYLSFGGGYSQSLVDGNTIIGKFTSGGVSQELGQGNIISSRNFFSTENPLAGSLNIRSATPIGEQGVLGKSYINELSRISSEGKILPTTIYDPKSSLVTFQTNPDGTISFIGSSNPSMRIYQSGKITFTAKDLNIKGFVIDVQDEAGNNIGQIQTTKLSPQLQKVLANQLSSAVSIAKLNAPSPVPPTSIQLFPIPSYLGGGYSTRPQVSSYAYNPEMLSPSLVSGATVESQPLRIPPSSTINLNLPSQEEITRTSLIPSLRISSKEIQSSKEAAGLSSSQSNILAADPSLTTMTLQNQIQPQVSQEAQILAQQEQQQLVQPSILIQPQPLITPENNISPVPPIFPLFSQTNEKRNLRFLKATKEFLGITKRRGKEIVLGTAPTPELAERLAVDASLKTLARSVIVREKSTLKQVPILNPSPQLFRPSKRNPLTFVERNALQSKSEVREIESYKKRVFKPYRINKVNAGIRKRK